MPTSKSSGKTFRDREKARLIPLKSELFSNRVGTTGEYGGKRYAFCLERSRSEENLWEGIRDKAIAYFASRGIRWHDGISEEELPPPRPSNHLCCSQTSCVNTLFPYMRAPEPLKNLLWDLGFENVSEVLPFTEDVPGRDGTPARPGKQATSPGFVAFEWIGTRNYLGEHAGGGKVAKDGERRRGAHFTSADFAFRFIDDKGKTELVLGEWKYTEAYARGVSLRFGRPRKRSEKAGRARTDRLAIYRPALDAPWCQISRLGRVQYEDLMYDPFDQLMRLQLLASEMEHAGELGADRVSVMHVAPDENGELMRVITSPALERQAKGADLHETWARLVEPGRFKPVSFNTMIFKARFHGPSHWNRWMQLRYMG